MQGDFKAGVTENSVWAIIILAVFLFSSVISWFALAQLNFLYEVWHDRGGVAEHIEKFAPQNKYKIGFGETSAQERKRLFAEIIHALHLRGEGLRELKYQSPNGQKIDVLLREPEVVHLEDVARLVGLIKPVGVGSLLIGLCCLAWLYFRKSTFPPIKVLLVYGGGFFMLLVLIGNIWGPTALFYQLHRWVFPDGHQWFFYYQDSLMSTMMMAPDMFGYIAVCLAAISTLLAVLIIMLIRNRWRFI